MALITIDYLKAAVSANTITTADMKKRLPCTSESGH